MYNCNFHTLTLRFVFFFCSFKRIHFKSQLKNDLLCFGIFLVVLVACRYFFTSWINFIKFASTSLHNWFHFTFFSFSFFQLICSFATDAVNFYLFFLLFLVSLALYTLSYPRSLRCKQYYRPFSFTRTHCVCLCLKWLLIAVLIFSFCFLFVIFFFNNLNFTKTKKNCTNTIRYLLLLSYPHTLDFELKCIEHAIKHLAFEMKFPLKTLKITPNLNSLFFLNQDLLTTNAARFTNEFSLAFNQFEKWKIIKRNMINTRHELNSIPVCVNVWTRTELFFPVFSENSRITTTKRKKKKKKTES